MTLLIIIAKAAVLIILAGLLFFSVAEALNADLVAASKRACVGAPVANCFLAII